MSEPTMPGQVSGERLQKVLARAGFGSRRSCEDLIRLGRVKVDGQVVTELGTRVLPRNVIAVDGRVVPAAAGQTYLILNKPAGYVTTASDPQGRPTVLDLAPTHVRLFPVGRLDADSEGLVLLTNDGDLTYRITHPRFGIEKEYRVLVSSSPDAAILRQLREGVDIEGRRTAPALVSVVGRGEGAGTWLQFVIHEGRKRQIRRMCEAVGLAVRRLIRTRVGPLRLGQLAPGATRPLTEHELKALRAQVDPTADEPLMIAIDGPAGSGKSSLAEALARQHHLLYLDTGAMYRAVTLLALRRGINPNDEQAVSYLAERAGIEFAPPSQRDGRGFTVCVDGKDVTWDLYTPEVGRWVSIVSAFPGVRQALVRRQREIARRGDAVVVGRDIGTVVLPDAPIKLYLDASPEVRAERRLRQLRERGVAQAYEEVLAEIRLRDRLDSERAMSPLAVAPDAVVLNSDHMTVEQEMATVDALLHRLRTGEERK